MTSDGYRSAIAKVLTLTLWRPLAMADRYATDDLMFYRDTGWCRRRVASHVHHVKTAASCIVDTDRATSLAVVHVTSARCLVSGPACISDVNYHVISRARDLHAVVRVTNLCHVDILVLDCVESRAFRCVVSVIARYVTLILGAVP